MFPLFNGLKKIENAKDNQNSNSAGLLAYPVVGL